jgi:hypothetical protein
MIFGIIIYINMGMWKEPSEGSFRNSHLSSKEVVALISE